jgi:transcriptional regulator with XRE-family HTH domain
VYYHERLEETRLDHDETQEITAKKLKITRQQYQLYESGKRKIPIDKLKIFCEHYGVSADYILGLPKGLEWPR